MSYNNTAQTWARTLQAVSLAAAAGAVGGLANVTPDLMPKEWAPFVLLVTNVLSAALPPLFKRRSLLMPLLILALLLSPQTSFAQQSKPVVPAQPEREFYGIQDIALLQWIDSRETYQRTFGAVPPEFNPAHRPKYWFDTSVDLTDPEADVCYQVPRLGKDGLPRIVQSCMPAWEAARVNIPGGAASTDPNDLRGRPAREIPVRALAPNEALVFETPFGMRVIRTDLRLERERKEGKFLPEDRALLLAIARKLGVAAP